MAAAPQDVNSSKHMLLIDTIIAWMIGNPGKPMTHCAAALGLSTQWVRMVASTDAFKARMSEQRDNVLREVGMMGLKERIAAAAETALDRLTEKLTVADNIDSIKDATEMLLEKHFALEGTPVSRQPGGMTINVHQAIVDGRSAMLAGKNPPAPIELPVEVNR